MTRQVQPGTYRWVNVDQDGHVRLGTSFPSEDLAKRNAWTGDTTKRVVVVGKAGPFSDYCKDAP